MALRVFVDVVSLLFLLTSLVSLSGAAPSASTFGKHVLKESVHSPRGWERGLKPHPTHLIELRIALPQPNFHLLREHLYSVSNPEHVRYGQHLTKAEVEALVAPHNASVDIVNSWLAEFGIFDEHVARSPARDWVTIVVPVSLAEKMLDTVCCVVLSGFGD